MRSFLAFYTIFDTITGQKHWRIRIFVTKNRRFRSQNILLQKAEGILGFFMNAYLYLALYLSLPTHNYVYV